MFTLLCFHKGSAAPKTRSLSAQVQGRSGPMGGASSARRVLDARIAKPHGTGLHQRSVSYAAGVGFAIPKPGGLFKQPARVSLNGGPRRNSKVVAKQRRIIHNPT